MQIFMEMIEPAGKLIVMDRCPYIYFIKKGKALYIGETQRNPLSRWGQHFNPNGSFYKAVRRNNEEIYKNSSTVEFYAYRCVFIEEQIKQVERRRATQYVENQIHLKFFSEGSSFKIISDTVRTTPVGNKYIWLKPFAESLYFLFKRDLQVI